MTTYDYADRPATLLARRSGKPDQPLVNAAGYLPAGPLSSLTLGNGRTETRAFTQRYFPSSITLNGLLGWSYATDGVGNILSIADTLNAANNRAYGYQSNHYFLTQGNGPWGPRSWTYDKIGNRLTETRGATTDSYSYVGNSAAGRTPILSQIQLAAGGTRAYQFGPAGHLEQIATGADATVFRNDAASRLSAIERAPPNRCHPNEHPRGIGSTRTGVRRELPRPLDPVTRLDVYAEKFLVSCRIWRRAFLHRRFAERCSTAPFRRS